MDVNFAELHHEHGQTRTAFQSAFDRLYQTFDENDKAVYTKTTLEDVLLKLHDLDCKHMSSSTTRTFGRRLQPVLYNLERYARAMDALAQIQSMPTSLIWGTLRIIMEAAGSFVRYFGKLVTMIERLGDSFSLYRQYEELLGHDARFEIALGSFYYHMLVLLSKAKNVFLSSGFKILCRSLWRTFEMDFQATAEALARDNSVLSDEITLAWRKKLRNSLDQYEERHQSMRESLSILDISTQKSLKLMEWLMPADMTSVFLRESQRRIHASGVWLSNHGTFQNWLRPSGSRRLWIHGCPGSGKTVLSTSIIETIQGHFENDGQSITAFFFCSRNDEKCQSALDVLASIIAQVLYTLDDIPAQVFAVYSAAIKCGRSRFSSADNPLALLKILAAMKALNIIIDGLDESENPTGIMKDIEELQSSVQTVRVVYLSRDLYILRKNLSGFAQIKMSPVHTAHDIDEFLSRMIPQIMPEGESSHDYIHSKLSKGADGMFLWANLMIQTLKAATSAFEVNRIVENLPHGLEVTYKSILKNIALQSTERQELARKILLWTCCALRPLRWEELQYALAIDGSNEPCDSKKPFKKAILELCAPLIEYSPETDTFRPAHLSVREFLFRSGEEYLQEDRNAQRLFINGSKGHLEIAGACLTYLSRPDVERDARIGTAMKPLAEYATMCWCLHLTSSRFCLNAYQNTFEFLSCQLRRRVWIARFLFLDTAAFPLQRLLTMQRSLFEWSCAASTDSDIAEATDWIQDTTHILIDNCNDFHATDGDVTTLHEPLNKISHFEKLMVIRDLSREYTMSGRLSVGENWLTEALHRQREVNGTDHVSTAWLLNGLGIIYDQQKRCDTAIQTQEEALAIQEREHGQDHLETIWTVNELGRLYRHVNELSKAESSHLRALELLRRVLQPDDLQIAWTLNTLARTRRQQGHFLEAISMHYEAMEIQKISLGDNHPHILWALSDVARCHRDRGALDEAAALHKSVLQGREQVLGPGHADTLWSVNDLALVLVDRREYADARALHQRALNGQIKLLGEMHEHTLWTRQRLELMSNGDFS